MNGRKRVVRLGIDIGKNSFHLWGVNEQDERVMKKKARRCVLRGNMGFVAVKTIEQQELQALHRLRQAAVKAHTAVVNQRAGC